MAWFSVGAPALLQLVVPIGLLAGVAAATRASRATFVGMLALTAAYIGAIHRAGLWLVLPWYTSFAYAAALVIVAVSTRNRVQAAPYWPAARSTWALTIVSCVLAVLLATLGGVLWSARAWPVDVLDLALPFEGGTHLIVNGGNHVLVNAHLGTLKGERFAPYRGQSYGIDLVRLDSLGRRANGVLPSDPSAYRSFDEPVLAPCSGRVIAAIDGLPDMAPPQTDRTHMAGNHVIVECQGTWVVLGHLRQGSVHARAGNWLRTGDRLGHVGNSGNTSEPHLHLHAQHPGTKGVPFGGRPVPIRLDGHLPLRNDRLR